MYHRAFGKWGVVEGTCLSRAELAPCLDEEFKVWARAVSQEAQVVIHERVLTLL